LRDISHGRSLAVRKPGDVEARAVADRLRQASGRPEAPYRGTRSRSRASEGARPLSRRDCGRRAVCRIHGVSGEAGPRREAASPCRIVLQRSTDSRSSNTVYRLGNSGPLYGWGSTVTQMGAFPEPLSVVPRMVAPRQADEN
jgi:hypothetical protein